ncbi:hypothetical protein [Ramlibacter montanisoli]|nr:hypothetical protein [Ramlibacter montanisoli]
MHTIARRQLLAALLATPSQAGRSRAPASTASWWRAGASPSPR